LNRCLLVFDAPDGGVAEHVMRLALGMRKRGWQPWLVGPESAATYPTLAEAGVPIMKLPFEPGYRRALQDAYALRAVVRLLRRHRFDLVNTHSPRAGVLGRIAALTAGVPAVLTAHGFPFNPAIRTGIGRALSLRVERFLAPRTSAYICVSDAVRQLALQQRVASPDSLHVVHNGAAGCDERLERDSELERFSREGPLAGSITVLRPGKGADVFLEAAAHVLDRMPEARLALVGKGILRGGLERRARAIGLDDRLRFFDYRGPTARQCRSLDLLVLASPWEALPLGLLEALACGVPQVATNVGGNPEVVIDGETGLLFPPNDPTALAERIVHLLRESDLRARMADASRARHRDFFTLGRMLDDTVAVYERVTTATRRMDKASPPSLGAKVRHRPRGAGPS
jgi:glycosyltransferase involved in cell wall biosynthesis